MEWVNVAVMMKDPYKCVPRQASYETVTRLSLLDRISPLMRFGSRDYGIILCESAHTSACASVKYQDMSRQSEFVDELRLAHDVKPSASQRARL